MSYEDPLDALRLTGQQYPDEMQRVAPLGEGLTHMSRKGVPKNTDIDEIALQETQHVYASEFEVRSALAEHGADTSGPLKAAMFIGRNLVHKTPILGFSGYATGGYPYTSEADGIGTVFEYLGTTEQSPHLVVDGGTRLGVPGLSGVIARRYGAATLGVTPRQGLDDIAPRDHLIVQGRQYGEETSLLGSIPDILVVLGGGPNGQKEYRACLKSGGSVLMLALKGYPADSLANLYKEIPETSVALKAGKLVVCNSLEDIPASLDLLLTAHNLRRARVLRILPILRSLTSCARADHAG